MQTHWGSNMIVTDDDKPKGSKGSPLSGHFGEIFKNAIFSPQVF